MMKPIWEQTWTLNDVEQRVHSEDGAKIIGWRDLQPEARARIRAIFALPQALALARRMAGLSCPDRARCNTGIGYWCPPCQAREVLKAAGVKL